MPFATTNYGWTLPDAGAEPFSWEPFVRTAFQGIDTTMFSKFDKAGGTISGALSVTGTATANSFVVPNQATNGARAQFTNSGGTLYVGLDYSGTGGLGGPYTANYWHSGPYDHVWASNDRQVMRLTSAGHLLPAEDNTSNHGSGSLAIKQIYTNNSVIVTSDGRLKTARSYTAKERAVARRCRDLGVAYQWNDAIAQKGADRARLHFGTTVQSVIAAFEAEGLDPFRYGVVCYDEWEAQVIEHPAVEAADAVAAQPAVYEELMVDVVIRVNGEDRPAQRPVLVELQPAVPAQPAVQAREAYTETVREAGSRYSLRYEQLNFFIATAGA